MCVCVCVCVSAPGVCFAHSFAHPLLILGPCLEKVQNSGIWELAPKFKPNFFFLLFEHLLHWLTFVSRPIISSIWSHSLKHLTTSSCSHPSVFNFSVSALPTSSSRWDLLSFSALVKRWDLVGLLELMTKRSTGLPSRWIDGSQASLRPLSAGVCFPLWGRRGFSAAKQMTSG